MSRFLRRLRGRRRLYRAFLRAASAEAGFDVVVLEASRIGFGARDATAGSL